MNVQEIEMTMQQGSHLEKLYLLSHLKDIFESYNEHIENFALVVQLLVQLAVTVEDEEITDGILDAICTATRKDISQINFEPIAEHLKNFSIRCLTTGIDILSYTHDKKYLTAILDYKNHQDDTVKETVKYALMEMGEC